MPLCTADFLVRCIYLLLALACRNQTTAMKEWEYGLELTDLDLMYWKTKIIHCFTFYTYIYIITKRASENSEYCYNVAIPCILYYRIQQLFHTSVSFGSTIVSLANITITKFFSFIRFVLYSGTIWRKNGTIQLLNKINLWLKICLQSRLLVKNYFQVTLVVHVFWLYLYSCVWNP